MKTVQLVAGEMESNYPIKQFKELNIHSEYFLVDKGNDPHVRILRYFDDIKEWYIIRLDSFCTNKLKLDIEELTERFYVYCIPEYTGGSDGIYLNNKESGEARKELLEFLINKYM